VITTLPAARADLSNCRVRITALDVAGCPWPDPVTGFGALGIDITPPANNDGDKLLGGLFVPIFAPTAATGGHRMHLRTHTGVVPGRSGAGSYACELFIPRNGEWDYAIFPRVRGTLMSWRVPDDVRHPVVLALSGTMLPNPNLGTLVTSFRPVTFGPKQTYTDIAQYTGDVPEVTR